VFYLNHSEFPIAINTINTINTNTNSNININHISNPNTYTNSFYKEFENNLLKIADNIIKSQMKISKFNRFNFLSQLLSNDFFDLKIINRTKKLFLTILLDNFKTHIEADLFILFEDYLNKINKPSEKELEFYYENLEYNTNLNLIQEKQSNIK
jgi:hypothetical protein